MDLPVGVIVTEVLIVFSTLSVEITVTVAIAGPFIAVAGPPSVNVGVVVGWRPGY